jgi:hypothetical protein
MVTENDNSHICWNCRKTIEDKDIHCIEDNKDWASFGYCICRNCWVEFLEAFEKVSHESALKRHIYLFFDSILVGILNFWLKLHKKEI